MRKKMYFGFSVVILTIITLLFFLHVSYIAIAGLLIILTLVAIHDLLQNEHAVLRNFPILGHARYILENLGPEIRQYIIANDQEEHPFNRQTRALIYQRSKSVRDTIAFGTQRNFAAQGYECVQHSLAPKTVDEVETRLLVGERFCSKPFNASYLNISGMSYGALSGAAILALGQGAKLGNFALNTGEGGISPYHFESGADLIFQVGTGYFGCRTKEGHFDPEKFREVAQHDQIKMIELKLSQGAKPAHGGILPGAKVSQFIADMRGVEPGVDCLSPPGHSAFSNPTELLEFIAKLRELSGGKPIGFKLCIGKRHEFLGICKAMLSTGILPDFITVDGAEGGTGAAPVEFVDHMGTPLKEGLLFVHNSLFGIGVRHDIRIIAAGKIATGFDIVSRMALGADMCNSGRAFMLSIGCIQSLQCHANTCPTGIATQDPSYIKGLDPSLKKIRAANYHHATMHSFLEIIGAIGLGNPQELRASHIFRQTEKGALEPYNEIYQYIKEGSLLSNDIPKKFARAWAQASPDQF